MRSSQERGQEESPRSTSREPTMEGHTGMEDIDPTMEQSDVETQEEAALDSPLNEMIPHLSTKEVQPLVETLWDNVQSLDLHDNDSRKVLVEMCLEVISSISNLILDAFRILLLKGEARQGPLVVSEEAVSRSVESSLSQSLTSVVGTETKTKHSFLKILTSEVTRCINSVLCCSRIKGQHLRLAKDNNYKPAKEKMNDMIRHIKSMVRNFQKKVRPALKEEVPDEENFIQSQYEEPPCGSGNLSVEEEPITPLQHTPSSLSVDRATDDLSQTLLNEAVELSQEERESLSELSQDIAFSIIEQIVDQMENTPKDSRHSPITEEQDHVPLFQRKSLTGVIGKIQSFFAMCFAKTSLRRSLAHLCCQGGPSPAVSLEDIVEQASSVLEELVHEEEDTYKVMHEATGQEQSLELCEELTTVIHGNMALATNKTLPRRTVRQRVEEFMNTMNRWLFRQMQLPTHRDPVQRVLSRLSRLFTKMTTPPQSSSRHTYIEGPSLASPQGSKMLKYPQEQSDVETQEEAAFDSPLNKIIPHLSTEEVQPLVETFWNNVQSLDLLDNDSRKVLVEMCLEVISSITNLILDAFRNLLLEGEARQGPLLVSEEAVSRSVESSLSQSLTSVAGTETKTNHSFLKILTSEVTRCINSVLCCSRIKGQHLHLAKDMNYKPAKDNMNVMIRRIKSMVCNFQKKVRPALKEEVPDEENFIQSQSEEPPARKRPFIKKLTKVCHPCGSGNFSDEEEPITPLQHSLSSLSVDRATDDLSQTLLNEAVELSQEERESLSELSQDIAFSIIEQIVDQMENTPKDSRHSPITEEQDHISLFLRKPLKGVIGKIQSFFVMCFAKTSLRRSLAHLCCHGGPSPAVSLEDIVEQASSVLEELVHEEEDTYKAMHEVTGKERNLELCEELTTVIHGNMALTTNKTLPRRTVRQRVEDFMNSMNRWLFRQMQLPTHIDPVQRVLSRLSRLLTKMTTPPQSSSRHTYIEGPSLASPQGSKMLKYPQEQALASPQHSEGLRNTQQQPLASIRHLKLVAYNQVHPSEHAQLRETQEAQEVPLSLFRPPVQTTLTPPALTHPLPASRMDMGSSSVRQSLPGQWTFSDISSLVCELVSRIFQTKWHPDCPEMVALSRELQQKLEQQVSTWEVLVTPSRSHFNRVADAVYRDLCRGRKREHVAHNAIVQSNFSSEVINSIRGHLEQPLKRRCLGSRLRSAWDTFWRC